MKKPWFAWVVTSVLLFASAPPILHADEKSVQEAVRKGWSMSELRHVPAQSGGRIKPLDSLAREVVLFETGSRTFEGWDPTEMLVSFISNPDYWDRHAFVQVSREDVRRQLGLDEKQSRFAPHDLITNPVLAQYAMHMGSNAQVSEPIQKTSSKANLREQELKRVLDRLGVFRRVVSGEAWTVIPMPAKAGAAGPDSAWASLADNDREGELVRQQFIELLHAYQAGDEARFDRAATMARAAVEAAIPGWREKGRHAVQAEVLYNRARPFLLAWVFYLLAALAWTGARATVKAAPKRLWTRGAFALTFVAVAAHVLGFALRCYIAGRPPVTNMYESIVWVMLGQMVFSLVLYAISKQPVTLLVSCVLATVGLIAGDAAPAVLDPGIHPLVPVLRSNYWLTIHVLTITLGYAAFALTMGLANVSLFQFLKEPSMALKTKIAGLNQLTYRAMQIGVVLLAAGTILGGVWADYSWGRFWGWDPKEVWALIALLCYVVILHGRFAGWVGQFGFAAWSVVSFLSVLMAWYGVNFVLGVGLHSYGFSTGGFTFVMSFVAVEAAYLISVLVVHRRYLKAEGHAPSGPGAPAVT